MDSRRVRIVNLLATDLTILSGPKDGGTSKTYYNPGPPARVVSKVVPIARIYGYSNGNQDSEATPSSVPLLKVTEIAVVGLPDPEPDTLYVVSGAVAGFLKGSRKDVVSPSRIVEDNDGWIVGCRALLQLRDAEEMKS